VKKEGGEENPRACYELFGQGRGRKQAECLGGQVKARAFVCICLFCPTATNPKPEEKVQSFVQCLQV